MEELFTIKNISDVIEIEKIPLSDRVKANSTLDIIEKGAEKNPNALAISYIANGDDYLNAVEITYEELLKRIRQTANMFYDLGIRPDDVISYVLPTLPETHYVLWGGETAGIVNPINPMLNAAGIRDLCRAAGTKILVTPGEIDSSEIWEKVDSIRKDVPTLKFIVNLTGPSNEKEGIFCFNERIDQYPGDKLTFHRNIKPDDISSVYHTGGATGSPKLARRTHYNEIVISWELTAATGIKKGDSVFGALPLFHCNGTIITGLLPFSAGAHIIILTSAGFRQPSIVKNFFKIAEHYRLSFFSAVPTILSLLLDVPVKNADLSSMNYVLCGAAPLSKELFRKFENHTGLKILEGYGLTECAVATCLTPKDGERKIGSVGIRLPYQKIKTAVIDDNWKYIRDARANEIGSILVKGPCVFKGYADSAHNKRVCLPDGWFNTGDMGRIDEDEYVWLTGRKKDLIIRGGHNIDPLTIEVPLRKMPNIKKVAAIGRPDAHAGEVPIAYVEIRKNSKLTKSGIMKWANEHIGEKAAVPKDIIITNKIPVTATGKIFKPALRWEATKQVYLKELDFLTGYLDRLDIQVTEDKIDGTIAKIYIKAASANDIAEIKNIIAGKLAKYTIGFDIIVIGTVK